MWQKKEQNKKKKKKEKKRKEKKRKAQLLSMCHGKNWKREQKNILWCFPLRELNNVKYMSHL